MVVWEHNLRSTLPSVILKLKLPCASESPGGLAKPIFQGSAQVSVSIDLKR